MPHHYTTSDVLRFQSKVKVMPSGCHEWQGAIKSNGYGVFWCDGKMVSAHRIAYELERGPIVHGASICHTCDNRKCVNPEHLFLGTQSDNLFDASRKGRLSSRGRGDGNRKLTKENVIDIRGRHSRGESQVSIARSYSIHKTNVSLIVRGITWTDID